MIILAAAALAFPLLSARSNAILAHAPPAIGAFLERRAECDHWAGEEPYDKARARQIERAAAGLKCARLEADERALRRLYRNRQDLKALLKLD